MCSFTHFQNFNRLFCLLLINIKLCIILEAIPVIFPLFYMCQSVLRNLMLDNQRKLSIASIEILQISGVLF